MIFDCHQHVVLPTSAQLAAMDEAGIDRAVLLSTLPHIERSTDIASFKQEMSVLHRVLRGEADGRERPTRELREALAEGGERFVAFGKVPVGLPYEATVKALLREVLEPGYAGCRRTDLRRRRGGRPGAGLPRRARGGRRRPGAAAAGPRIHAADHAATSAPPPNWPAASRRYRW